MATESQIWSLPDPVGWNLKTSIVSEYDTVFFAFSSLRQVRMLTSVKFAARRCREFTDNAGCESRARRAAERKVPAEPEALADFCFRLGWRLGLNFYWSRYVCFCRSRKGLLAGFHCGAWVVWWQFERSIRLGAERQSEAAQREPWE